MNIVKEKSISVEDIENVNDENLTKKQSHQLIHYVIEEKEKHSKGYYRIIIIFLMI